MHLSFGCVRLSRENEFLASRRAGGGEGLSWMTGRAAQGGSSCVWGWEGHPGIVFLRRGG